MFKHLPGLPAVQGVRAASIAPMHCSYGGHSMQMWCPGSLRCAAPWCLSMVRFCKRWVLWELTQQMYSYDLSGWQEASLRCD